MSSKVAAQIALQIDIVSCLTCLLCKNRKSFASSFEDKIELGYSYVLIRH